MDGGRCRAVLGSAILGGEGMSSYEVNIRPGNIARHTPRSAAAQGREAAVIDIAQDLLLRELQDNGTLALVAIKGAPPSANSTLVMRDASLSTSTSPLQKSARTATR